MIVYHTTPFIHMLDAGARDQGEIPILNDLMLQEVGLGIHGGSYELGDMCLDFKVDPTIVIVTREYSSI